MRNESYRRIANQTRCKEKYIIRFTIIHSSLYGNSSLLHDVTAIMMKLSCSLPRSSTRLTSPSSVINFVTIIDLRYMYTCHLAMQLCPKVFEVERLGSPSISNSHSFIHPYIQEYCICWLHFFFIFFTVNGMYLFSYDDFCAKIV